MRCKTKRSKHLHIARHRLNKRTASRYVIVHIFPRYYRQLARASCRRERAQRGRAQRAVQRSAHERGYDFMPKHDSHAEIRAAAPGVRARFRGDSNALDLLERAAPPGRHRGRETDSQYLGCHRSRCTLARPARS